ncbi:MAG TPA: LON peptidase substrate-binding domain-containing protein [Gaiellaceae bacterium]|nr:LON peptidase substrate-binding domain-containing protein [Gaiellaceae bacterium]
MDEIGLFPLGIVLLPGEEIPLHIFEPRYRELIGECLELGREFGLILADGGGLREVGTVAAVREVLERHDDGRLDIVVRGRSRFRVVQLTSGRSFQTARIEPFEDAPDAAAPDEAERALTLFERLVELTGSDVDPPEDPASPQLSFELAARFEFAPPLEQELLQERSERRRLVRLCELLEGAATVVAHQQEVAARAATNGKVQPGPS